MMQELPENVERLHKLGGVDGIVSRIMRTSLDTATHLKKGLAPSEIEEKRLHFGANTLPEKVLKTWFELFKAVFADDDTVRWLGSFLGNPCVGLPLPLL